MPHGVSGRRLRLLRTRDRLHPLSFVTMPKYLLYASAVLLICSAGLSFLNKNKMALKNVEIADTHAQATSAQNDATKAKAAQKVAEKNAADATTKANDTQTQLTAAQGQVTDLTTKLADTTKKMTDDDTQLADLQKQVANLPKAAPGAPPEDIAKKIDDLTKERDELKVVKEGLESQTKSALAQVASLQREQQARATGASMNGLRGQVLAVDHNWNFVVLNLGNRNGVNNNASMIIQRGGSMVGRVKITSVEPSQSVADIVPNSVPAGIDVRPGDTVVFPGGS